MAYPPQGVVAGDMTKAVYDPDKDGKIALAQLVAAVCSETEADTKVAAEATARNAAIATHAELPTVHQDAPALILTHKGDAIAHQNAPALITTHAGLPNVHHTPPAAGIWTLAETLSPASAVSIDSSVLTARDLWMIIIDITLDVESAGEKQVEMRINDNEAGRYDNRYVDDTTVVTNTGVTEITLGSFDRHTSFKHRFAAILWIAGKAPGASVSDRIPIIGIAAGYGANLNRILNATYETGVSDITKFNFLFDGAVTGKIKIYSMNY